MRVALELNTLNFGKTFRFLVSTAFIVMYSGTAIAMEKQKLEEIKAHVHALNSVHVSAYNDDYEQNLCGKCKLVRTNYKEVVITFPHCWSRGIVQKVVTGNVQRLAVRRPYVVGYATRLTGDPADQTGFFVLNSETGKCISGLTERKWQMELTQIKWPIAPLAPPP